MKKSILLVTAMIMLAACQKNKETAPETVANAAEIQLDATATVTDSLTVPEVENEVVEPSVDAEKKTTEVTAVNPANGVTVEYASFGAKIAADKALTKEEMIKKYNHLNREIQLM